MEILYEHCCGLDVHKRTVVACLITGKLTGKRHKEIRTLGATTEDLVSLSEWLSAAGCTHVAMESTGSYWKPIYNVLEDEFELLVANAQHVKALPGRKTDVGDAEWIADLLQHGLLRGSFIPSRELRELRELTRHRKSLIQLRCTQANRIQKVLEGANIKLASVISNVLGVSGRAMLAALVEGQASPAEMADLAHPQLRVPHETLAAALTGDVNHHQRFVLGQLLNQVESLDNAITECSAEIAHRMSHWDDAIQRLCTIPGVGRKTAEVIMAEIGPDMSRFPTHRHLASWAGMCPGNHESAGRRKSGKTRKGSKWLRQALIESASSAAKTRDTYLSAQYRRLAARRGRNKATVALGHTILMIAYYILRDGTTYHELGPNYFDELKPDQVRRRMVRRLEALGYQVTLEKSEAASA